MEFEVVSFWGGSKTGKPGEKPSEQVKKTQKLNPHMTPTRNRTQITLVTGECSHHTTICE